VFDYDFEDALLILVSLICTKHELPFKIFESKFEGCEGRHFYGRPRAAHGLATPLNLCEASDEDKKQHYCGDLVLGWGVSQNIVFNHK